MSEYLCPYYNTEVQVLSPARLSPFTPCRPSPRPVPPGLTDSISGQGSLSLSSECDPSFLHVLSLAQLGAQPESSLKESPGTHLTNIVLMSSTIQ